MSKNRHDLLCSYSFLIPSIKDNTLKALSKNQQAEAKDKILKKLKISKGALNHACK
jgi:hypothetical protein